MATAAAIRITSPDETRVIEHAAWFAKQRDEACYVVTVVPDSSLHVIDEAAAAIAQRNLAHIRALHAIPIVQEGADVARALLGVARAFGIDTLFVQAGSSRVAERLLLLEPPFDVVVIGSG